MSKEFFGMPKKDMLNRLNVLEWIIPTLYDSNSRVTSFFFFSFISGQKISVLYEPQNIHLTSTGEKSRVQFHSLTWDIGGDT